MAEDISNRDTLEIFATSGLMSEQDSNAVLHIFLFYPASTQTSRFQFEQEPSLPQVISFSPLTAASIIADAHPTPLSTFIAFVGQLSWQAPHSIQAFGFANLATLPPGLNTLWGHTMLHMPQLMHNSGSYSRVFERYELNISNPSQYSH